MLIQMLKRPVAMAVEAAVSKKSFKEFLSENGFPFLNVYNNEMETLFGHKKKDYVKGKEPKTEDKEEKTKRKLNSYMRYAKNINEEENNGR